ncbi:hypothetical protein UG46_13135 [Pseudomonas fluorescens]|nr:hypothetical protein UG46_13135 [Pseudomonas fluorescens]
MGAAPETGEYLRQLGLLHARPPVAYGQPACGEFHSDLRTCGRMLDGVFQQVFQQREQRAAVGLPGCLRICGPSHDDAHARDVGEQHIEIETNGQPLGEIEQAVLALPSLQQLPPGLARTSVGDAEALGELASGFGVAMLTGVACIYMVLVLLLKDFLQPPRTEAIIDACGKRARPIVMTTIAMGAGMMPIALGWGTDPSFRAPMAIVLIGGLITSTVLSLLVIPVVFSYVDDGAQWLYKRMRHNSDSSGDGRDRVRYPAVKQGDDCQ